MTLREVLRVLARRWIVVVVCALVAGVATWFLTPATPARAEAGSSYTATATMLLGGGAAGGQSGDINRVPLLITTGEVPKQAAAALDYDGDPAVLASKIVVTPDFQAGAVTIAATNSKGEEAAAVANAFATASVDYFTKGSPQMAPFTVSIIQEATPIANQAKASFVLPPGRLPRTLMVTLLGLLLGIALAFAIDRIDLRLRSRQEIQEATGLPIIAEVPKAAKHGKGSGVLPALTDPLSYSADAYRAARVALVQSVGSAQGTGAHPRPLSLAGRSGDGEGVVFLITSAHQGEGKTTATANIAASMAEAGQEVLVLDGDLRSPNVHVLLDVQQGAGISDYLADPTALNLESLSRPTIIPGVRLITAGTVLEHPAAMTSRMPGLIGEAREMADVVLIDTAPMLAASDVYDLVPQADAVAIVVRSGRLEESEGRRVDELLRRFRVVVAGVILIGAKKSSSKSYGYGYGYGYGAQQSGRRRSRRARRGRSGGADHQDAASADAELPSSRNGEGPGDDYYEVAPPTRRSGQR